MRHLWRHSFRREYLTHRSTEQKGMLCGQAGKKLPDSTKEKALEYVLKKGLTVPVVAARLKVSQSVVRNWVREAKKSS